MESYGKDVCPPWADRVGPSKKRSVPTFSTPGERFKFSLHVPSTSARKLGKQ